MTRLERAEAPARKWVALAFTLVEDVVYIGLGVLLAMSAITLSLRPAPWISRAA